MKWIIVLVLGGLVYWLFANGIVQWEDSVRYISDAFANVFATLAGFFGNAAAK